MVRRAFTLIELMVAMALLAMIVAMAGVIFRVALTSYRMADAQAEILRKKRLITQQIDDDFAKLRLATDAPIFIGWAGREDTDQPGEYVSFDRIVFFSRGGFQSIGSHSGGIQNGSLARITYMLAGNDGLNPEDPSQLRRQLILTRTQHIMAAPLSLKGRRPTYNPTIQVPVDTAGWSAWHNDPDRQYDDRYYRTQNWLTMDSPRLYDALTGMTDMDVDPDSPTYGTLLGRSGTRVSMRDPEASLHKILCQGVGQFRIEGWYGPGTDARWVPDPSRDLNPVTGANGIDRWGMLVYPYDPEDDGVQAPYGFIDLGGIEFDSPDNRAYRDQLRPQGIANVPGLGRALRFTFTLYDSRGLVEDGMTFTHIVNLDR